jgi:hypothetical protein
VSEADAASERPLPARTGHDSVPGATDGSSQGRPGGQAYLVAAVPVLLAALAVYWATLLPDVGLWDTAEFQAIGPVLGIAHPTGYPTYTLLAWLASVLLQPFGNEAYRADLLSALLMSGAAALLAIRVTDATRRPALGIVAGLAFGLTPLALEWGVRADPHPLHAFLAALIMVLLGRWQAVRGGNGRGGERWLLAAAVVYGLSLGNHALTLLLAPGIAAFVLMVAPRIVWQQWRLVLTCAVALLGTAALVYLYLPLRASMDPPLDYAHPDTWASFWYVVLGEQFRGAIGALPPLPDLLISMWQEIVANLGLLSILALAGAIQGLLRHPRLTLLSLLWFGATWLFATGYPNANIERYYLVPLLMASLWVGLAADAAWDALRAMSRVHRGAGTRSAAGGGPGVSTGSDASSPPSSGGRLASPASSSRTRLDLVAPAVLVVSLLGLAVAPATGRVQAPPPAATDGRAFLRAAFEAVAPDAVIISWWSYSTPLWYGRYVEGDRPDVTIIDDRDILDDGYGDVEHAIDRWLGQRPVYIIRLGSDVPPLAARYELEPVASVPAEMYLVLDRRDVGLSADP